MSEKVTYTTEEEWLTTRRNYGMSLSQPPIPDGTEPFEDWELNIRAQENNLVVCRSKEIDRFMATIRELQLSVRLLQMMSAGL